MQDIKNTPLRALRMVSQDRGKTERSGDPPLAKRIVPIHEIGNERSGQRLAKLEQAKDAYASITTGK